MITQEELKALVSYDPETGIFTRLKTNLPISCKMNKGYIVMNHKGKVYLAHRLAFLYMTGSWPNNQVDHINRSRDDNTWKNLREATPAENSSNRIAVGVYECTRKGRTGSWFYARIICNGKSYSTTKRKKEDAEKWRRDKELSLFGEFAKDSV